MGRHVTKVFDELIAWTQEMHAWGGRVRRDIRKLERTIHKHDRELGLPKTQFFPGDPGAPPPPPWDPK
jgi:hypothetical protein